mmetsp:Transcript_12672/g.23127  ORF Transcript_12672/g.23127 Transcript_12672/m.23127 type:complete len:91 (+) Transcript_12672:328-600(+)
MLRLLLVRLRFMGAPGTILSSRATLDTTTTTTTTVPLNLGYTKHTINTSKLESVLDRNTPNNNLQHPLPLAPPPEESALENLAGNALRAS